MKLFIILFLFFNSINCFSQFDKYNFNFIGLSDEYSERFLEHKQRITKGINSLDLPHSFFPVDISISYENGEGIITISANYIHDDIFTPDSKYSRANINRRVFGEGITFILPKILITILRDYKFDVATNGGYKVEEEFFDFKSSVKLNSGQDFVQIFAYDQYNNQRFKTYFYSKIFLKHGNEIYELEPKNVSNFNDIDFFYIGKTSGLDGKPTPYYYFSKFFKIDEWAQQNQEKSNPLDSEQIKQANYQINIPNRQLIVFSKPVFNGIEEGVVVVEVTVDKSGNVIEAIPGARGTTSLDRELFEASKHAALKSKFNEDLGAPEKQKVQITYRFTLN